MAKKVFGPVEQPRSAMKMGFVGTEKDVGSNLSFTDS